MLEETNSGWVLPLALFGATYGHRTMALFRTVAGREKKQALMAHQTDSRLEPDDNTVRYSLTEPAAATRPRTLAARLAGASPRERL